MRNGVFAGWSAAIGRGTATYDPAAARSCVDEISNAGCDILDTASPEVCADVLVGTIELGGRCVIDEECAGNALCADTDCVGGEGICTMQSSGGDVCVADDGCVPGLVCEASLCVVPTSNRDGPCGGPTPDECPLDQQCVGATETTAGTCTTRAALQTAALGESCDVRSFSVLCQSGLRCAVTGFDIGTMQPEFECATPVGSGGACFVSAPSMCPSGEYCDADPMSLMFAGSCIALPGVGEPCAASLSGESCQLGLICIRGETEDICRRPQDNGQACDVDEMCHSTVCVSGLCVAPSVCAP